MDPKQLTVGLLGYGSFGKLVAKHLGRHASIVVYHPTASKSERLPRGCSRGTAQEAASCQVVILSVNLAQFEGVLKNIRQFVRPGAIVADVMSVKVKPVRLMKRYLPKHAQTLATHPLFGPQSVTGESLAGHKIIIHPVRLNQPAAVKRWLKTTLGLKVIEMTPQQHDRKMALVHGLTFFLARGLLKMRLPEFGLDAPSYRKLLSLAELEKHHSPDLFKTIEAGNPYAAAVRRRFIRYLDQLHRRTLNGQ